MMRLRYKHIIPFGLIFPLLFASKIIVDSVLGYSLPVPKSIENRSDNPIEWSLPISISNSQLSSEVTSIGVSVTGDVHIVFGEDDGTVMHQRYLFYKMKRDPGDWSDPLNLGYRFDSQDGGLDLVVDSFGGVHIVWEMFVDNIMTIQYAFKPLNNDWQGPYLISGIGNFANPAEIDTDSTGGVHVTWVERNNQGEWNICYRYKTNEQVWSETVLINEYPLYSSSLSSITVDSTDVPHMVWGENGQVYYSYRELAGAWSNAIPTSDFSLAHGWTSLAADELGNIYLVWQANGIYFQMKSKESEWSDPVYLVNGSNSKLVSGGQGEIHLIYLEGFGSYFEAKYIKRQIDGLLSTPVTLSTNTGEYALHPSIAIDQGSYLYASWQDYGTGYSDIYYSTTKQNITAFLDLPFAYGQHHSLALQNHHVTNGKVTSWFDHDIPTFPVTLGNGVLAPYFGDFKTEDSHIKNNIKCYEYPEFCYDDHDGYDFGLSSESPILAAGDGEVYEAGCGDYGYQVVIKHPNNYYSLYGHLNSQPLVAQGDPVTTGQQLGVMGGTARIYDSAQGKYICADLYPAHLHFGVYYDANGDDDWNAIEVVDPNGWYGESTVDPAVTNGYPSNSWLWVFERDKQTGCGVTGCAFDDLGGDIHVSVPLAYFSEDIQLSLFRGPIKSRPQSWLFSIGYSFWLRLLDISQNTHKLRNQTSIEILSADPIIITIDYSDESVRHLDETSLVLYRWDDVNELWESLSSSVDAENNILNAETFELGEFDAQGQVLCTEDYFIHDDSYLGAELISSNNPPISRIFDIVEDEDWFRVETIKDTIYSLNTLNLAQGVDTTIELYDIDGVTLLGSDDDGGDGLASKLEWISPASGVYFIRVSRSQGSAFGCSATYETAISTINKLFLPIAIK